MKKPGLLNRVSFRTTNWTTVAKAGVEDGDRALEELLKTYWYPLYSYIRQSGREVHDAKDLTQGFLIDLLARKGLEKADRDKGKFRSYLLGSLRKFLANSVRYDMAQKRGGGDQFFPLDLDVAESTYLLEGCEESSPIEQFNQSWAMDLLARVMRLLESECEASGRRDLYLALKPVLSDQSESESLGVIGRRLGISANAASISLYRLRKRYGEILRDEIANTVETPEEIDTELNFLLAVVSR